MRNRWLSPTLAAVAALGIYGVVPTRAQQAEQPAAEADDAFPSDSDCPLFGPNREHFQLRNHALGYSSGRLTEQFSAVAKPAAQNRATSFAVANAAGSNVNLIDQYIFAALKANNVTPANLTTDYEFIRRVTLDLTGRIPVPADVTAFVNSSDPNKRAALVDTLLAKPEWVDKWTMFYGDLFKNTASNAQITIRPEGRNAFYKYIHDSLAADKPYNQMATEMIAAQGNNSFDQTNGQLNYLVLGYQSGGPNQDIFDYQTAAIADQFLGLAHVNCLLCHNGKGHLDTLSLWGGQMTRTEAESLSAFLAHTWTRTLQTPQDPSNANAGKVNYYSLDKYTTDYQLNTTTGNRPARQPVGNVKVLTPVYPFNNNTPAAGEDYRVALARNVTGDFQFARAAVNYLWAYFFGVGLVDPPDQFDPLRQDPNNPPPAPWTLQASNPALLNALAQSFIDSKYDVKAMMRTIANSQTYQLASDYPGTYSPTYDQFFARKFVRRLWAEEIHDSINVAIQTFPSYTVPNFTSASTVYGVTSPGFGKISFAMQAPEVVNMPDGGAVSQYLDVFLRGNRDDQPRKEEGSILQALYQMNDNYVQSRIHATGSGTTASFLQKLLTQPDPILVQMLYMSVLSRQPSATELATATGQLAMGGAAQHTKNAEDLLWTLFNKVDFLFNY